MKKADVDGSGAISFKEFVILMVSHKTKEPDQSVEFRNAFGTFDRDDSKTVSSIELINIISMLGLEDSEEVCEFLREHTDSHGMINYEQIVKLIFEPSANWAKRALISSCPKTN